MATQKQKNKKAAYIAYRQKLDAMDIHSFIDQNGNTFTACEDCIKEDCKCRETSIGCMIGEPNAEIAEKIKR